MIVESKRVMGDCDDCGTESRLPMLVPWVWARIAPGVVYNVDEHRIGCGKRCQCGVLCQGCAERRLGRELTSGDFQDSIAIRTAPVVVRAFDRDPPYLSDAPKYTRVGDRIRERGYK